LGIAAPEIQKAAGSCRAWWEFRTITQET